MTGERYGKLVVIERDRMSVKWLCRCDCGNEKLFNPSTLQNIKSCGCGPRGNFAGVKRGPNLKARLPKGEAAFNRVFHAHKTNAKVRKLEQSLTREQFKKLCSGNCVYCDAPPSTVSKAKHSGDTFVRNGVDRWDNSKGYTVENSVSCCTICNYGKKQMSGEEWLAYLDRLARFQFPDDFASEAMAA
ncbi:hypothetical protein KIP88_02845 [Bradyrhizobium sp. SRL28]|uniref:hypothetical protein n=1 Tax=Bradyrhizobium sp. SRL28 TaxID=2836178 RepID=UPI001BDE0CFD|nr:hypothetical protein [Bradyrhizobium sp. SRL28]MBT1509429.1 hypothetical protein [Bradyrhizobium sp. SRL28]